jgi:hypothetical protein
VLTQPWCWENRNRKNKQTEHLTQELEREQKRITQRNKREKRIKAEINKIQNNSNKRVGLY